MGNDGIYGSGPFLGSVPLYADRNTKICTRARRIACPGSERLVKRNREIADGRQQARLIRAAYAPTLCMGAVFVVGSPPICKIAVHLRTSCPQALLHHSGSGATLHKIYSARTSSGFLTVNSHHSSLDSMRTMDANNCAKQDELVIPERQSQGVVTTSRAANLSRSSGCLAYPSVRRCSASRVRARSN